MEWLALNENERSHQSFYTIHFPVIIIITFFLRYGAVNVENFRREIVR